MVRGESLQVLEERMKTMDPDENKIYKFLGMEQVHGIWTKMVFEGRGIEEGENDGKHRTQWCQSYQGNKLEVISVATYAMKICRVNDVELKELDQMIKIELQGKNMLGWESRQVMNDCTWRERKAEEDWSRWGMLTKRKDCVSPATWPSRPTDGLKLHGEKRQSKRRMQSLWNGWRRWRKLDWDCAF